MMTVASYRYTIAIMNRLIKLTLDISSTRNLCASYA